MMWEQLGWTTLGGFVGGSGSAFLTGWWTHKKWERTARGFKTMRRALMNGSASDDFDVKFDDEGCPVGLEHILRAESENYSITGHPADVRVEGRDSDEEHEG